MAFLCPLPSSYRRRCPGHPLPSPSHRPTALEIAAVTVWIRAKVAHDPQGFVLEVVAVVMVQPSEVLELHWEADAVASCHEKLPCSHEAGPALVPLVDAARIFTAFRSRAARAVSHPLAILSQATLQQVANRGNQLFDGDPFVARGIGSQAARRCIFRQGHSHCPHPLVYGHRSTRVAIPNTRFHIRANVGQRCSEVARSCDFHLGEFCRQV